MRRERNAPRVEGELRLRPWRPGVAEARVRLRRSWSALRVMLADSGPMESSRLLMAAVWAVAGAPALVRKTVSPPWERKIAPGAWDWGPAMMAVPPPVRWRVAALRVVRAPLRVKVQVAGASMVPPVVTMGGAKSKKPESVPPRNWMLWAETVPGVT